MMNINTAATNEIENATVHADTMPSTNDIRRVTKLPETEARALADLIKHKALTVTAATESRIRRTFAALAAKGWAETERAEDGHDTLRRTYRPVSAKVAAIEAQIAGR